MSVVDRSSVDANASPPPRAEPKAAPTRPMRALRFEGASALSKEQLREVHVAAAAGDRDAVEWLVRKYQGLARSMATRTHRRAEDLDDLFQVANYGLLKAIERFDPWRGFEFSTFAFATIDGELKRYRRSTAWAVHVPRAVQERFLHVSAAADELAHELGRQPTVVEIADRVGVSDVEVIEVLDSRDLQRPTSLSGQVHEDGRQLEIPVLDGGFGDVERVGFVDHLLSRLSEREQVVVRLRFHEELTQSEIADRLGMSQMHVSRLLRRALDRLRALAVASNS